jgi:predicted CoA-binding protein
MAAEALKRHMFGSRNWVVVGDVLDTAKPAHRIRAKLVDNGYNVAAVNPRIDPANSGPACYRTFAEVAASGMKPEVLDLCINPTAGRELIKDALALGVRYIFIQPGAADGALMMLLHDLNVHNHQGCVLVDMPAGGYATAAKVLAESKDGADTAPHRGLPHYDTSYIQLSLTNLPPLPIGDDATTEEKKLYDDAKTQFTYQYNQHQFYLDQAVQRTQKHLIVGLECRWFDYDMVCIIFFCIDIIL